MFRTVYVLQYLTFLIISSPPTISAPVFNSAAFYINKSDLRYHNSKSRASHLGNEEDLTLRAKAAMVDQATSEDVSSLAPLQHHVHLRSTI